MMECDTPDAESQWGSFSLRQFSAASTDVYTPAGTLNGVIGKWTHLAATFDPCAPDPNGNPNSRAYQCHLYLNAEEVNHGPFSFGTGAPNSTDLVIGNNNGEGWPGCPGSFNGYIDEVRIYDKKLTQQQVAYLADTYHPDPEDWKMLIPVPSAAELFWWNEAEGTRRVNFKDFAVIADKWLYQELWP
jgi:hypothetical protein